MSDRISVRPLNDEKHRLLAETGLVVWHYRSIPLADEVEGVPVWFFRFAAIEETAMQEYFIRTFKAAYRLSRSKAIEWLLQDRIGIPQSRVEIEAVR